MRPPVAFSLNTVAVTMESLITKRIVVSAESPDMVAIREAADILRRGGVVAFPTETVYGLGADALNPHAVEKVFAAKGRPTDNPLIVHLAGVEKIEEYVDDIPPIALRLADAFWPGPLTLVMKRSILVSDLVTAGLHTVGVRVPNHPVALALLREFGEGIVAPSANLSGRPSPTTAQHVEADLGGRIEMILDAGATDFGVESTVLDITQTPPVILRFGALTRETIEQKIGPIVLPHNAELLQRSPGTRYRHYAPKSKVILVAENDVTGYEKVLRELRLQKRNVGCIVYSQSLAQVEKGNLVRVLPSSPRLMAKHLFSTMRELEKYADVIVVESVEQEGLGITIMDRLRRAAE
jgi:L-threonylcarbamoyladenylate synthase